ncbi:MAG: hypothetical protein HA491_00620 [Candidatus Verstraetearchaeota archaeon]|nr:hypothetical protein [Candidatus Verstraetearchaeota archaeon]
MGVRVRVKLKSGNKEVSSSALVNTGYEGFKPEIHVPLALAKKLGFSLEDVKSEKYAVVGGEVTAFRLGQVIVALELHLVEDLPQPGDLTA